MRAHFHVHDWLAPSNISWHSLVFFWHHLAPSPIFSFCIPPQAGVSVASAQGGLEVLGTHPSPATYIVNFAQEQRYLHEVSPLFSSIFTKKQNAHNIATLKTDTLKDIIYSTKATAILFFLLT